MTIQETTTTDPFQDLKELVSTLDQPELQKKVDLEFPVARDHLKAHRYDEAFSSFKFLFANSSNTECPQLKAEMTKLASQHSQAKTGMKKWRDAHEKQIFAGTADTQAVHEWGDLNECLGDNERTLTGYHKLKDMTVSKEITEAVAWKVWKELVRVRRYEELSGFLPKLESMFARQVADYDTEKQNPRHGTPQFESDVYSLKSLRNEVIRSGAPVYELALALDKPEVANRVFEQVTTFDTSDYFYATFITSAIRAGADDEAGEIFEKAKATNDLFTLKETVNAMRKAKIR